MEETHPVSQDAEEREFWNQWNVEHREEAQGFVSLRQAEIVTGWLAGESGLRILDVGCGSGWMSERLLPYGEVTAVDLADEVIGHAQVRAPDVTFVADDFMTVDVGSNFDVIVCMEVLSYVADQHRFLERIRSLLTPGGRLMLTTENRPVLQRFNRLAPAGRARFYRLVGRPELRDLMRAAGLNVDEMYVVSPMSDHGPMRLVAKAGRVLHASRLLERLGFGWTIMVSATLAPDTDVAR
jgi:2-polyprenyl-3-methyl-5-hydroxy-6-metoxy-1,4-benzoquinol methylase